ncbi:MAG: DUF1501 domain-containing protein [Planctomycetaceae bacterium]
MLDQALSALLEDLEQRSMLDDVTVVVWGEFGRTPKINSTAGRDHWPRVSCGLLAGGGMPDRSGYWGYESAENMHRIAPCIFRKSLRRCTRTWASMSIP